MQWHRQATKEEGAPRWQHAVAGWRFLPPTASLPAEGKHPTKRKKTSPTSSLTSTLSRVPLHFPPPLHPPLYNAQPCGSAHIAEMRVLHDSVTVTQKGAARQWERAGEGSGEASLAPILARVHKVQASPQTATVPNTSSDRWCLPIPPSCVRMIWIPESLADEESPCGP